MSARVTTLVAASLCVGVVVIVMGNIWLALVNDPSTVATRAVEGLLLLAFAAVGALVASRRPANPIGWLFAVGACLWGLGVLLLEYGYYALITAPDSLPGGAWAVWIGGWVRGAGWMLIVTYLLLLFPDGSLPSRRWRPVGWGAAAFLGLFTVSALLAEESEDLRFPFLRNPLRTSLGPAMADAQELTYVLSLPVVVVCGAAVVWRFRHSRGDERQQLKWFAYAVALTIVVFSVFMTAAFARVAEPGAYTFILPLLPLPVAAGIAILRYRLYDIDLVIRRTLVYGALTILLAILYFGGVTALHALLRQLTGQQDSQLAIVATTLGIAAMVTPLRRRIQDFMDRRFYRRKYDAARTLSEFSLRMRDETNLAMLSGDLLTVVQDTVQPEHVSLWLRQPAERTR